jgi:ribosomal protein S18 acetylase RimI-like enzyme
MSPAAFFSSDELVGHKLNEPPPPGFDCGRDAQNRFLYESAWPDQAEQVSVTYLYSMGGLPVAFATASMNSVVLGTREKPRSIPYKSVGALHLAQLGVGRRYQGSGVGSELVSDIMELARYLAESAGCRYVTLDAEPDLVGWYENIGFTTNKTAQKQRIEAAAGKRDPADIPVSMRFDLLGA